MTRVILGIAFVMVIVFLLGVAGVIWYEVYSSRVMMDGD